MPLGEGSSLSVDWTIEELQNAIDEIVSGERLVEVDSQDGPIDLIFRYPSRKVARKAEVVMKRQFREARSNKLLTEDEMLKIIYDRKIWTEKDDKAVQAIKYQIDKIKEKMLQVASDPDIPSHVKSFYEKKIPALEDELFKVEYKKEIMMVNTAERKARQEKYEYLLYMCTYDPETDKRYWDNYLTFYKVRDTKFKNKLLNEFIKYLGGRSTEEIRFIARSNLWRISYVIAQKTNTPLFPVAVVDLTPDQNNLSWWAGYYDGIYQMTPEDQPDDSIIENDEALDKYMEELHNERKRERQDAQRNKRNPFGAKSARNMKEQLIMRDNPNYTDYTYDQVPVGRLRKGQTERTLKDEAPAGSKAAKQRSTPIKGSKRFKRS